MAETGAGEEDRGGIPVDRRRGWTLVAPALVSLAFLLLLDPGLWFRDTIPALTDLPGHLLPPTLLRDRLLPGLHLQGWSFDWFGGFPLYRFYFPLPGLLVALAGMGLPDALAFRLVAFAPLLLMPWALWALGRRIGGGPAGTVGVVLVGASSVLMSTHSWLGGNVFSVASGEFSYAWSLLFVVLHGSWMLTPGAGRREEALAGLALGAAALSHLVPVIPVVLGTLPFLTAPRHRGRILRVWILAGLLSAFWMLPMVVRLGETASMGWALAPALLEVVPPDLALLLVPAAYALVVDRGPRTVAVASVGVAALLLAVLPQGFVLRSRPLPVWYLTVLILAGLGLARAHTTVRRRGLREGRRALPVALVGTAGWLLLVFSGAWALRTSDWLPAAGAGVAAAPGARDLEAAVSTLSRLPPGRVHVEPGELPEYGGRHAFALVPYWTGQPVLTGLWAESAPLSTFASILDTELASEPMGWLEHRDVPALEWAPARSVERLRMLGVRYLITHSDATSEVVASAAGGPVARHGALRIFDLGPVSLIVPLRCWDSAPSGPPLRESFLGWFEEWRPGLPPLVAGGIVRAEAGSVGSCIPDEGEDVGAVSGPVLRGDTIRFSTRRVGVPHLIRASWFPDWRARGATGPVPASPWFMVVVPAEEQVVLTYGTGLAGVMGRLMTVLGAGWLLWLVVIGPVRDRRASPPPAG